MPRAASSQRLRDMQRRTGNLCIPKCSVLYLTHDTTPELWQKSFGKKIAYSSGSLAHMKTHEASSRTFRGLGNRDRIQKVRLQRLVVMHCRLSNVCMPRCDLLHLTLASLPELTSLNCNRSLCEVSLPLEDRRSFSREGLHAPTIDDGFKRASRTHHVLRDCAPCFEPFIHLHGQGRHGRIDSPPVLVHPHLWIQSC